MKNRKYQDNPEENTKQPDPKDVSDAEKQNSVKKMEDFFQARKQKEPARYTMNTPATLEKIEERYKGEKASAFIHSRLDAGVDSHVRLKGTKEALYMTGSEASGQFLTEKMPGETPEERKENLQLPESNDGEDVYEVHLNQPSIVVESTVAPQKEFAEKSGYTAREGIRQVFVPPKYGEMKPQVTVERQVAGSRPHQSERSEQENSGRADDSDVSGKHRQGD